MFFLLSIPSAIARSITPEMATAVRNTKRGSRRWFSVHTQVLLILKYYYTQRERYLPTANLLHYKFVHNMRYTEIITRLRRGERGVSTKLIIIIIIYHVPLRCTIILNLSHNTGCLANSDKLKKRDLNKICSFFMNYFSNF